MAAAGLRVLLGLLALYHLGIGVVSALSPARTARVAGALYALRVELSPALSYAIRMLGIYALAFSYLFTLAAIDPIHHLNVIRACILLLLLRAIWRLACERELRQAFNVSAQRNRVHSFLLVVEAGLLVIWFPS